MSLARDIGQAMLSAAWFATHPGALVARTRPPRPAPRAAFSGAKQHRLTASWGTTNTSIDADLWRALPAMRARSRDLFQNNEYARRFALAVRSNVAGPSGLTLQNRARFGTGKLDLRANDAIETAYRRWSKHGQCDVTRRLSRAELERLLVETVARDGEVLLRKVANYANRAGFAVQILEADHLDHEYDLGRFEGTGNRIRMGVEQDRFGAAVAYHIRTEHPGDYTYRGTTGMRYERVPADQMLHLFVPLRPEQTRGVPWIHAAMVVLHHLGDYREAAVVAARIGASKMGIITTPDGGPPGADPASPEPAGYGEDGATVREVEPGVFWTFAEGTTLTAFDPAYPHEQFDAFNNAALRGIAGALGMAHHNLSGDLSGVNYSSARIGEMGERDLWRMLQDWLIGAYAEPIEEAWLQHQLLTGRLALPFAQFDRLHQPNFVPRSWAWVDPLKQSTADKMDVDELFTTRSAVIRQRGGDPEEVFREAAAEQELLAELGLQVASAPSAAPTPEPAAEDDTATDDDDASDGDENTAPQRSAA